MKKFCLVFLFATMVSSLATATNCIDRFQNRGFRCTVKYSSGAPDIVSNMVVSFPSESAGAQFDWRNPDTNGRLPCSCAPKGTFNAPEWGASRNKFHCGSLGGGFVGTISRKGVIKLDVAPGTGLAGLGKCVVVNEISNSQLAPEITFDYDPLFH